MMSDPRDWLQQPYFGLFKGFVGVGKRRESVVQRREKVVTAVDRRYGDGSEQTVLVVAADFRFPYLYPISENSDRISDWELNFESDIQKKGSNIESDHRIFGSLDFRIIKYFCSALIGTTYRVPPPPPQDPPTARTGTLCPSRTTCRPNPMSAPYSSSLSFAPPYSFSRSSQNPHPAAIPPHASTHLAA